MCAMKNITRKERVALRRINLRKWIDTHHSGVQARFIEDHALNQSEISGLLGTKSFGDSKARTLEQTCGMPDMWLDLDHDNQFAAQDSLSQQMAEGDMAEIMEVNSSYNASLARKVESLSREDAKVVEALVDKLLDK